MATAPTERQDGRERARPIRTGPRPARLVPLDGLAFLLISGLYLTFRGYHAFDGDQAYRLPLLLHRQDPAPLCDRPVRPGVRRLQPPSGVPDPARPGEPAVRPGGGPGRAVRADARGDALGVDRLARAAWPGSGGKVGLVAVGLVLLAKAGNIGTNHLFEATLLDRLVGFALGWLALASAVGDPRRGAWAGAVWLGLAALVHPSVGLQLALTLAATWAAWGLRPAGRAWAGGWPAGAIGGARAGPGCRAWPDLGQGGRLFGGSRPRSSGSWP